MAGFFSRLAKRFGSLWSGSGGGQRALSRGVQLQPFSVRRGSRAWLRAYKEHAALRTVVETVADAVAAPRWRVYVPVTREDPEARALAYGWKNALPRERARLQRKALDSGKFVEVEGHLLQRMLEDPSPKHPGRSLRKLISIYLDGPGECFLWLRRSEDGTPVGFEVLPPTAVLTTPAEAQPHYQVAYNLFTGTVSEADIIWLRHLDPENPEGRGIGRGLSLGDELDASQAIQAATKATFERGPHPTAIVGVKADEASSLPPETLIDDASKRYQDEHVGPEKAGKPFFIAGDLSFTVLATNNRELQTQQIEESLRRYIRMTYNVSPELIGELGGANRSTAEEAKYILAEHAVLPRLEFLRAAYQKFLVPKVDPNAIVTYDDPTPQAFERIVKVMTAAPNPAFKYRELRELVDYPEDAELGEMRPPFLPGAAPIQDTPAAEPSNPPPPRGPAAD